VITACAAAAAAAAAQLACVLRAVAATSAHMLC
jgi:hypothetical protein